MMSSYFAGGAQPRRGRSAGFARVQGGCRAGSGPDNFADEAAGVHPGFAYCGGGAERADPSALESQLIQLGAQFL